jgi:hypothetical protein
MWGIPEGYNIRLNPLNTTLSESAAFYNEKIEDGNTYQLRNGEIVTVKRKPNTSRYTQRQRFERSLNHSAVFEKNWIEVDGKGRSWNDEGEYDDSMNVSPYDIVKEVSKSDKAPKITLQDGKTYITFGGEIVTVKKSTESRHRKGWGMPYGGPYDFVEVDGIREWNIHGLLGGVNDDHHKDDIKAEYVPKKSLFRSLFGK